MNQKLQWIFEDNNWNDNFNKHAYLVNETQGLMLDIESMTINLSHLNFQTSNSITLIVEDFSQINDGDILSLHYKRGRAKLFSGVARVSQKQTDRIGNKTVSAELDFPLLGRREFKKVILEDEFFLEKNLSNPDDMENSILHIIASRLGFESSKTRFDSAKFYYQAGLEKIADIPFTLFQKGNRWIDEITTLIDAVGGYLFIDETFSLVYRSFTDLKFKEPVKVFKAEEIHTALPYKYNAGTNNGVKVSFDRFEMEKEYREVFKAEKKAYAKVGEKLNLKLKYITDIVVDLRVKSCKVYYYINEKPVYIEDYSPYVKFSLNANNGEIQIDNTFTHDIYVDDVVIEGKALMRYEDNSTILKDKTVTEELQEDFLSMGKNKYIQTFYGSRNRAVSEYYRRVRDTHNLDITIDFHPEYELGDKVRVMDNDYCIDRITHSFDHRAGYRTKLYLIQVLNPDFLNILWKESETVNASKPQTDLDLVNGLIDDKVETSSKDTLDKANGYTDESKRLLEDQLANAVKDLEDADTTINSIIDGVKGDLADTETGIRQTIDDVKGEIETNIGTVSDDLNGKIQANTANITLNANEIKTKVSETTYQQDKGTMEEKVQKNTTDISQNAKEIALKASQTNVDTLTDRVTTAEAGIVTNANAIKLKAESKDVDSKFQNVNEKFAQIDIDTGGITQTVGNLNTQLNDPNTGLAVQVSRNTTQISQTAEDVSIVASKTSSHDDLLNKGTNIESSFLVKPEYIKMVSDKIELDANQINMGNGILLVDKVNSVESAANTAQSTANNVAAGHVQINANTSVNGKLNVFGNSGLISYNGATEGTSTKRIIIEGGRIVFQQKV